MSTATRAIFLLGAILEQISGMSYEQLLKNRIFVPLGMEDLYLWDQALYTERLLPGRLRELLFKPNLESYGFGWGILIPKAGSRYAGESIEMHGGAIFGFQSLIERIPQHRELIVLLDNADDSTLLEIALELRIALSDNP